MQRLRSAFSPVTMAQGYEHVYWALSRSNPRPHSRDGTHTALQAARCGRQHGCGREGRIGDIGSKNVGD